MSNLFQKLLTRKAKSTCLALAVLYVPARVLIFFLPFFCLSALPQQLVSQQIKGGSKASIQAIRWAAGSIPALIQDSSPVYLEYEVDDPVAVTRGNLIYPPLLKAKKITGSVLLRFVVDSRRQLRKENSAGGSFKRS
jgi:hypothetical protein